jgi:hypothetical protein
VTNSKDTIGNRFRDLPVNSDVSEPNAPLRAREKYLQHVSAECEQSGEFVNAEADGVHTFLCALNV